MGTVFDRRRRSPGLARRPPDPPPIPADRDDEIRRSKAALARGGDPDAGEFAELTEFVTLRLPDAPPEYGLLRVLCNLATWRYRVVMRNRAETALLLNHYLVPMLALTVDGNSVSYVADDYADPRRRLTLRIQLSFRSEVIRSYFQAKFELGIRINTALIEHGLDGLRRGQQVAAPPVAVRQPPPLRASMVFPPNSTLDGIIAHLARECGGNVHDSGVVTVTGSVSAGSNPPKNAADLRDDSVFWSAHRDKVENIPHTRNHWLCYDFKARTIRATHYSVRSHSNDCHLKSWLVEVSDDAQNWIEIDHRENTSELKRKNVIWTFQVENPCEGRFIRLVNIGRNHFGHDAICIRSWEIFGSLIQLNT